MTTPISSARRIVIKVGSSLLIDPLTGSPHGARFSALASDAARQRLAGKSVVIVSSGAVALGRKLLGLKSGKSRLEEKQAAAAAGQPMLMRAWDDAFRSHDIPVAQALLTFDDTERRRRWLNARATLETLLERGAIPIVNENDTVATDEIRYGDNDRLAARVAQMLGADVLVLLSDIDGLYEADPRSDPNARHIPEVRRLTPEIVAMAGGANRTAGVGSGGMATKLEAARIAMTAGCATAISLGDQATIDGRGPVSAIAEGARTTWFMPEVTPETARRQWLAGALKPAGSLSVDAGAARALLAGKSLLPAGLCTVSGRFDRGDAVDILDPDGRIIGRGISAYSSDDALRLIGRNSADIEAILGFRGRPAIIHVDDLALSERQDRGA
ncbi:MAG: glutamate 5-kinase [Alphaproteobacteria bacterium]|nr:glutamate 5-kinase [Alphaproteobacteria bacterium]